MKLAIKTNEAGANIHGSEKFWKEEEEEEEEEKEQQASKGK